jgi:predicted porin
MKVLRAAAASAAVILSNGAGGAYAADLSGAGLNTKAPALNAAPVDASACTSIVEFFATACQVAAYGVRFYGTIDVGFGYQTHGAPLDKFFAPGVTYFPGKMNAGAKWLASPNALSQSNIGFQIKEPLGAGWSFVGQVEAAFDPYTLELANGVGSVHEFAGVPLARQNSNGDASSQGRFYNSLGFAGVSNDTWGTLTFMRQNTLMLDGVRAYDPMAGSYAFSLVGFFGATAGGGDTENARATTSVKYRVNFGNYRLGLLGQFGGYELGNGSKGAFQGELGADYHVGPGVLSVDVIGGFTNGALSESLSGGTSFNANTGVLTVDPTKPQTLGVTISDNTNIMALAKYTVDRLKLYAGYEWMQFANPSDVVTTSFSDTGGYFIPGSIITNNAFIRDKILQVVWAGVRYSVTDSLDVVGAYYHYDQNEYATGATLKNCMISAHAAGSCSGTQDVASALIDWKFAPKWDTYIGLMFTQLNGGLDSGLQVRNNWETTAGLRFRW